MVLKGYLYSFLYVILCIIIALVAYKLGSPKKYTRKIVHILVGFEWIILYNFLSTSIHTLIICVSFTLLLLLSYLKKLLPMMSSDGENDPGTVYYGVAMTAMALISYFNPNYMFAFGIGVFCTSIGDGFAGLLGSLAVKCNFRICNNKTVIGTLAGFVFSFISVIVFSTFFALRISVPYAVAIAALSAGVELISRFGLDNIFIPFSTSIFSYLVIFDAEVILPYIVPIILTPYVIALVHSKNLLTRKGIFVAILMDIIVSAAFHNFGFVYLLAFLALSVVVDKVRKHFKKTKDEITKKGENRDEIQVLANGLFPIVMAVIYLYTGEKAFIVAYCAGLAEAFSDTCASGFGMLSRGTYDILTFKKIPSGLSGGISLVGTAASFIAAVSFSCIGLAFGVIDVYLLLVVAGSAFIGNIIDSILGSLAQVKYKCRNCGIVTEKEMHCGEKTEYFKGLKKVDNDIVNLVSTFSSSVIAMLLYFVFFK